MRLINVRTLILEEFYADIPAYAILSHCWSHDEVTFKEWQDNFVSAQRKKGYGKIQQACAEAMVLGYGYLWCDTNCIDKTSSAELTEAINSMFDWYALSDACLAYLDDVPSQSPRSAFCGSRWFTRGWTLQELLAPPDVRFYDKNWAFLGLRSAMTDQVTRATGIDATFLEPTSPAIAREKLDGASIAMRMSWLSTRETTRAEDLAYCMLGIFGINMPLLYGEGIKAFQRLQEEIIRATNDMTLFCWHWDDKYVPPNWQSILAPSPRVFTDCGGYRERLEDNHDLTPYTITTPYTLTTPYTITTPNRITTPYTITNAGLSIKLHTISVGPFVLALLHVAHPGPMVYRPETASWPVRILSRFSYDPATQFALLLLRPEHLYLATDVYVRCRLPPMPVPQYMCHDIRAALGSRHQANLDGLETRDMQIAFRPTHLRARQAGLRGAGQETYGISDHDLDFKVGIIFKLSSSISASPLTSGAKNILALERDLGSGWFLSILPITSKRHDITLWIGFAASDIKYERGAFRRHCFGRCLGSTPWLREYESELIGDYKQKMVQEVTFRERTALEPANPSPDHRFHVAVDVGESFSAGPHCDLALAHIVITDL